MARLKTLARRLLDGNIRTLIKGGLLNNDLTITERGRAGIDALIVEKYLSELVEIAKERIEEDKEGGCN